MTGDAKANWATLFGLAIATILGLYWIWGLLFIFWSLQSLKTGSAYLLLTIKKAEDPILFYAVCAMWMFFGVWEFVLDFFWRFGIYSILGIELYPAG